MNLHLHLSLHIFPGCLNGGGQIRPAGEETPKELLSRVEEIYGVLQNQDIHSNSTVDTLYEDWLGGKDSEKAAEMLHTKYHAVEKMNTALNIKW